MKEKEILSKIADTLELIKKLGYKDADKYFREKADKDLMSNADIVISASLIACIQALKNRG